MAAVVDPVGLKAYWSARLSFAGATRNAGYRYLWTIILSTSLDKMGSTDIGQ